MSGHGQESPGNHTSEGGNRYYERTALWHVRVLDDTIRPIPVPQWKMARHWCVPATCPECDAKIKKEEAESGLIYGGRPPFIVEQNDEWTCCQCGLIIDPETDLERVTAEDRQNAEKCAMEHEKYIESHKEELLEQAEMSLESLPLYERQLLEQMADAEKEYELQAYYESRERAKHVKMKAHVAVAADDSDDSDASNVYAIEGTLMFPHPVRAGKTLQIVNPFIYVNPNNNQAYFEASFSIEEIEKAGIYKPVVNNFKIWLPVPRETREMFDKLLENFPRIRGRNHSDDLSKLVELLSDGVSRTFAEIDGALHSAHGTSKRVTQKNADRFEVTGGGRRGKPAKVTLKSISSGQEEQFY